MNDVMDELIEFPTGKHLNVTWEIRSRNGTYFAGKLTIVIKRLRTLESIKALKINQEYFNFI